MLLTPVGREGASIIGQPPKHGQLSLSNWKPEHAKRHLSLMTRHANEVAAYHRGTDPMRGGYSIQRAGA